MRRKLSTLLVGVVAAGAALFSVHPVEAAPLVAVRLTPNVVWTYADANYVGLLNTYDIPWDCDSAGYNFNFQPWQSVYWSLSSVRYRWGGSGTGGGQNHCNSMWVGSYLGNWWGTCIHAGYPSGITWFGQEWNDKTTAVSIKYWPGCPLYTA